MLQCTGLPELSTLRDTFRLGSTVLIAQLHPNNVLSDGNALHCLKLAIFSWDGVIRTAKFIHEAVEIWSLSVMASRLVDGSDKEDELST